MTKIEHSKLIHEIEGITGRGTVAGLRTRDGLVFVRWTADAFTMPPRPIPADPEVGLTPEQKSQLAEDEAKLALAVMGVPYEELKANVRAVIDAHDPTPLPDWRIGEIESMDLPPGDKAKLKRLFGVAGPGKVA